jgi:hypothetical protein
LNSEPSQKSPAINCLWLCQGSTKCEATALGMALGLRAVSAVGVKQSVTGHARACQGKDVANPISGGSLNMKHLVGSSFKHVTSYVLSQVSIFPQ